MSDDVQRVKFQGRDYILMSPDDSNSALTTEDDFLAGRASYAHVYFETKDIVRFHERLGSTDDLELGERYHFDMPDILDALFGMLTDPSWDGPPPAPTEGRGE